MAEGCHFTNLKITPFEFPIGSFLSHSVLMKFQQFVITVIISPNKFMNDIYRKGFFIFENIFSLQLSFSSTSKSLPFSISRSKSLITSRSLFLGSAFSRSTSLISFLSMITFQIHGAEMDFFYSYLLLLSLFPFRDNFCL